MAHKIAGMDRPNSLVTGASSGIGRAFARRLSKEGHDVILVARRKRRLDELAEELGSAHGTQPRVLVADLAKNAELERVAEEISGLPALAMLVNSAGFGTRELFSRIDASKPIDMLQLHVMATVRLARAALPAMIASGQGTIINVSSLGAFFTTARYVTYSASKACVNMFTRGLAAELAGTGVRVQALCPGLTRTEFIEKEEFEGFDYGYAPAFAWMTPERVVEQSLAALGSGRVVFVPGMLNRAFVGVMTAPVAGRLVGGAIDLLGRLGGVSW